MPDKTHEPGGCAQLFFVAAAGTVAAGYFLRDDFAGPDPGFAYFVKLAVIATALSATGAGASWLEERIEQSRRDRAARKTLERLKGLERLEGSPEAAAEAGGARPHIVYLRPFSSTGKLAVENRRRRPLLPILPGYHRARAEPASFDLEAILTTALAPLGRLLAVGKPGEQIGAGRVESDEMRWRADVTTLLGSALCIILLPSHRPGTTWEAQLVRDRDLLDKCVLLMPPGPYRPELDLPALWARAHERLAPLGLHLPEYRPEGLLFRLDAEGSPTDEREVDWSSHDSIRASIESLLDRAPPREA